MSIVEVYEWLTHNKAKAHEVLGDKSAQEVTDIFNAIGASTCDEAFTKLTARLVNPYVELAKRNIVDLIYKEAKIEGINVTYPQTAQLYENHSVNGLTIEDVIKVNNLKHAWQFIFDTLDEPVTLQYVSHVNYLVEVGLRHDCGELRTYPVSIGGTTWKPEMPDKELASEMIAQLSKDNNALMLCAYLMRAQLFSDGNKRTAQIVANKMLISSQQGILAIPPDRIADFFNVLISFYETNNYKTIHDFLQTCIDRG